MKFDIITIFPRLFDGFLTESLLARAQKKKLISIKTHDLRKWTDDKHKTVDGRPYGGGAGMVLKPEPIYKAVRALSSKFKVKSLKLRKDRIILLSAKGKTFTQGDARRLAKYDQIILICGRYEGVDERVAKYVADEEISIGNYVLFGGEVPAMVIMEAISRLVPGVVAKEESIKNESFSRRRLTASSSRQLARSRKLIASSYVREHPQYTRPEVFVLNQKKLKVPSVLLSGDHEKIKEWRKKYSK